jgi:hypothetical protein
MLQTFRVSEEKKELLKEAKAKGKKGAEEERSGNVTIEKVCDCLLALYVRGTDTFEWQAKEVQHDAAAALNR